MSHLRFSMRHLFSREIRAQEPKKNLAQKWPKSYLSRLPELSGTTSRYIPVKIYADITISIYIIFSCKISIFLANLAHSRPWGPRPNTNYEFYQPFHRRASLRSAQNGPGTKNPGYKFDSPAHRRRKILAFFGEEWSKMKEKN